VSKVDLRLQCGMPCSKLEVATAQHGTLSGTGYLHQSHPDHRARQLSVTQIPEAARQIIYGAIIIGMMLIYSRARRTEG
jgi:hypothetical protein